MNSRARLRRKIWTKLGHAVLLLALLPGLLIAQGAAGGDLLLHAHGSTPAHVHLVSHETTAHAHAHPHGADHAQAFRLHDDDDDDDPMEGVGRCTFEFRLRSPGPLIRGSARPPDSGRWILANREIDAVEPWVPRFGEKSFTAHRKTCGLSARRKHRSNLVSLLSSSRAILI